MTLLHTLPMLNETYVLFCEKHKHESVIDPTPQVSARSLLSYKKWLSAYFLIHVLYFGILKVFNKFKKMICYISLYLTMFHSMLPVLNYHPWGNLLIATLEKNQNQCGI